MDYAEIKGVMPAIITPMNEDGELDVQQLEKHAAYLSDAGVDGFVIGGTSAEGAYLSTLEKKRIHEVVRDVSRESRLIYSAYSRPSTADVLEEMKALAATKPDYVVAVTPYYHAMRQDDIIEHYRNIAANAPVPLLLYNIPSMTHNPIALETVLELADDDRIAGMKDSSGDFVSFSRGALDLTNEKFSWIQGSDYLDGPSYMVGCSGVVTGLGNARIEPYIDMHQAARHGDWEKVRTCQRRINDLGEIVRLCGNSIAAIKAATEIAGRGTRWLRQKSQTVTREHYARIEQILDELEW